ncbi:MAG: hypothetical protein ACPGED_06740 [Flavobacteriales bacterium]
MIETITFYARLLTYDNMVKLTDWFNDQFEKTSEGKFTKSFANITVGGGCFQGTKDQIEAVMLYAGEEGMSPEWSTTHPEDTVSSLVKSLKEQGKIQ